MPETVSPNPPSPFADADPQFRHILPVFAPAFLFGPPAQPGHLAIAGCGRLTVVPTEPLRDAQGTGQLPEGLCPLCLAEMRGERTSRPRTEAAECRRCGARSTHTTTCAICRIELHEQWVAAGSPDGTTFEGAVEAALAAAVGSAAASSDDDSESGDDEPYPAEICVDCDVCGTVHEGDYVVTDAMSSAERHEVARAHLRTIGWSCTPAGDYCPKDIPQTTTTTNNPTIGGETQ